MRQVIEPALMSAVTAFIVAISFTTPDIITQVIVGSVTFLFAFVVLFVISRLPAVAAWPVKRQQIVAWLAAVSAGACTLGLFRVLIRILR